VQSTEIDRNTLELDDATGSNDLVERVLGGQVVVLRQALQQLDLFDGLVQASLEGIASSRGDDIAKRAQIDGFDLIHEFVEPLAIPAMTNAVCRAVARVAPSFLDRFVSRVFPGEAAYYFEHFPNVRFHIPYDLASPHRRAYDDFARDHGHGKIAPHGPHRDSWLDCPDNSLNLWIAVGPVSRGNGLSIFSENYDTKLSYRDCGEIADGERLEPPLNFDLRPGDVLVFHGNQLHASELNHTGATRFVVSYRITFGKPNFSQGHYHGYDHSGLARGVGRPLAGLPANLQWSYFDFRFRWLASKLRALISRGGGKRSSAHEKTNPPTIEREGAPLSLSEIPTGSIRPVSRDVCLARLNDDLVVAVGRRCPHKGADLATGFIRDGRIVCPWHNLSFDPRTGESPCQSLHPLRRFDCEIRDGGVHVSTAEVSMTTGDMQSRDEIG
jgi:nitrite reductase/ring-hydroxylating ferredoxin subunit